MNTARLDSRICLVAACPRLTDDTVCWYHHWANNGSLRGLLARDEQFDPLATHKFEFSEWVQRSQERVIKLEEFSHKDPWTRQNRQAIRELNEIRLFTSSQLIEPLVARWQAQHGVSGWRLPPDGWLGETMIAEFPELDLDQISMVPRDMGPVLQVYSFEQWADFMARKNQEAKSPTPEPFAPVTQRRVVNKAIVDGLRRQEECNANVISRHKDALHAYKHHEQRGTLAEVFDDPDVELDVDPDVVVFHQMRKPWMNSSGFSTWDRRDRLAAWAFEQHLLLSPGDIVRYEHVRSSTTKLWWFGSIHPNPHWLNSAGEEDGIRLELAPKRGLFLSDKSQGVLETHLGHENELLLPGDTWWEVVGIRDVVQADSRLGEYQSNERLRAIQMKEIEPYDVEYRTVKLLTCEVEDLTGDNAVSW